MDEFTEFLIMEIPFDCIYFDKFSHQKLLTKQFNMSSESELQALRTSSFVVICSSSDPSVVGQLFVAVVVQPSVQESSCLMFKRIRQTLLLIYPSLADEASGRERYPPKISAR